MSDPDRNIELYDRTDPMVRDFCCGMTRAQIGLKYGKSKEAVDSYLRRRKINKVIHPLLNDRSWLLEQITNGLTFSEIAQKLNIGTHIAHISKACKRLKIDSHNWQSLRAQGNSGVILEKEKVRELYENCHWSTIKIANHYGFSSDQTIRDFMRKNDIRIRLDGESNIKHDDPQGLLTLINDKKFLELEYLNKRKSSVEIADSLKCNPTLIQRRLKKFNIPIRDAMEYQKVHKLSGAHQLLIDEFNKLQFEHRTSFIYRGVWNKKQRKFEIDEYLPQHKTFVEVQGEHWHGLKRRHWRYKRVRSKMWSDLIKYLCLIRDYPDHRIIYVSEDDVKNGKWKQRIFPERKTNYDFNKQNYVFKICSYADISSFVAKHHYLQSSNKGRYYGLFENAKIVAACVISTPTRMEIKLSDGRKCHELSRLIAVDLPKNGLSYFIGLILKHEKRIGTNGIIAFADVSPMMKGQHFGSIYKANNFKLVKMTSWNYRYIDDFGKIMHKKTIFNRAKRLNMTEREYVKQHKYYKIPEWPKHKFEYVLNDC